MDIRAHVVALNEDRARVIHELDAEITASRGRDRSGEEQAKIDRMWERVEEIDAEVARFVAMQTREQESEKLREAQSTVFGEQRVAKREQTESEFWRSWVNNPSRQPLEVDIRAARRERELLRQGASAAELRALAWDTGSVASAVPVTMARSLYEYLEATICALRMPTTKIQTSSGEALQFPKLAAHSIATQVIAQGTAIGGTDPTFDRMQLDAYKYGQLVRVASEVLSDTVFDVSAFLGRDLGRAIGRVVDTDLMVGTGSNEPNGIMTAIGGAGTIATGGSLIDPTYEKLIDLVYSVNDAYRSSGAAWLMRDATAGVLRKIRDNAVAGGTSGAVMWEPSLTNGLVNGQPDRLLGFPVFTDPNVASLASNAKVIAFGDFSAYYIREVGNPVIDSDVSRYFDTDEVGFRGKWRIDGDCIDTTAYNVMKRSV